jgi:hypothetical protein
MKKQRKTIPFIRGLEKGDIEPQLTGEGQLLRMDDAICTEKGRVDTRSAFTALSSTYTDKWLGTRKDRPVLFGNAIAVKDSSAIRSGALDTVEARAGFVDITSEPLQSSAAVAVLRSPEICYQGDYVVMAYIRAPSGTNDYWLEVRDRYSGVVVDSSSVGATPANWMPIRLIAAPEQDRIYAIYEHNADLAVLPINTTNGDIVTGFITNLTGWPNVDTAVHFDAVLVDTDRIMMCYKQAAAGNMIIGRIVVSGDTVSDNDQVALAHAIETCSICKWDTGDCFIVYSFDAGATRNIGFVGYDGSGAGAPAIGTGDPPADSSVAATTTDEIGQTACIASTAATQIEIYWTQTVSTNGDAPMVHKAVWNSGFTAKGVKSGDASLWCKPFVDSAGRVFFGVYFEHYHIGTPEDLQRTYFLLEDQGDNYATPVGKWFVDTAESQIASTYHAYVCTPVADGTDVWQIPGIEIGPDHYTYGHDQKYVLHSVRVDTDVSYVKPHETLTDMVMPNASPMVFDGQQVLEMGFLTGPDGCTTTVTNPGVDGAWGDTGVVYYRAMYEIYDAGGNRYMSLVSPVFSATIAAATNEVAVNVPSYKISHLVEGTGPSTYSDNIRVVIYRIEEFGTDQYRRLTDVANDPTARTVSYNDLGFDKAGGYDVTGNEEEYTQNETFLQNYAPPPFTVGTVWRDLLVVVHRQFQDRLLQFSKGFIEGEGVFFTGDPKSHRLFVTPQGGDIIALEGMGDRLAIFKRRSILMTHGTGWDESGDGQGYAEAFAISEGVGCKEQMSVIRTPVGVFFQSDDCIYLLTMGYQLQPVGRSVRRLTDTLTITGADVLPDKNLVVWSTSDGTWLVYNYLFDQWATWTGLDAESLCVADGVLFYKDISSDKVLYEDSDQYHDDGTEQALLDIETGWISLGQPADEGRLWAVIITGYRRKAGRYKVSIAYDFTARWVDEYTDSDLTIEEWGPDEQFGDLDSVAVDSAFVIKVVPSRTRCNAVRFRIQELAGSQVWAATDDMQHSHDGGTTWTEETEGASSDYVGRSVRGSSGIRVFSHGSSSDEGIGLWNGEEWAEDQEEQGSENIYRLAVTPASAFYSTFATPSKIYVRDSDGAWTVDRTEGAGVRVNWIQNIPGSEVIYTVTSDSKCYTRTAAGVWSAVGTPTGAYVSVFPVSASLVWAVRGQYVDKYNGTSWANSLDTGDASDGFTAVWGCTAADGTEFAVAVGLDDLSTDAPIIYHWDGSSWTEKSAPGAFATDGALVDVWGVSENEVYAIGYLDSTGVIVVIKWDGSSWTDVTPSGVTTTGYGVWAYGVANGLSLTTIALEYGLYGQLKPTGVKRSL